LQTQLGHARSEDEVMDTRSTQVLIEAPQAARPLQPASGRVLLLDLRAAMSTAHARVVDCRRPPVDLQQLLAARHEYVSAMVAYEKALCVLHLPVPPRLRDDLRLLRRLVASSPGRA
jgi:hypothetical protein